MSLPRKIKIKITNYRKKIEANGINSIRVIASFFYFLSGIMLLYFSGTINYEKFMILFSTNKPVIFWCFGWSAFGIAAGLANSRNDNTTTARKKCHYFIYFLFVLFIASLAAFAAFLSTENTHLAYVFSALVAIVVGFSGDKLAGEIIKLKN